MAAVRLLLVLASTVILGYESNGTCDFISVSDGSGNLQNPSITSQSQSDIATHGQSVSLGVEPHLRLMTRNLLLFDGYGLVIVGRPVFCQSYCLQ
jgi:hypothetical protein